MATYEYDEAGVMAAYFLITFLALVLVPLTISVFTTRSAKIKDSCGCPPCIAQRKKLSEEAGGSIFVPKFRSKTFFLLGGWSFFAFVCYRASLLKVENKIYNPFEILGIDTNTPDKDIKSHFKKLSRMYHPDKVKVTVNLTIEAIQERFVELTKAYKSLTDEKIKENWIKYNHPDGPQTTTMGIALPKWIIEGKNNIWVLGVYGLVFGGALPALVGRWWFGSRQKTKDGINAQSAAAFFKSIKEESSMEEVVGTLGKAYKWELPGKVKASDEVDQLEKTIEGRLGSKWTEVGKLAQDYDGQLHKLRREALILLYSHLLRLDIQDAALHKRQKKVLLQTPLLLNALLNVSTARSWLTPSLFVMRLQAYLAQALPPTAAADNQYFTQLPGIGYDEIHQMAPKAKDMSEFLRSLEEKKDPRVNDVKKAMERWGHVEIVDAAFKVIGESIVTPSSIVFLLVKLRISPPGVIVAKKTLSAEETKRLVQANDKMDEAFLTSRQEAEDLDSSSANGSAHAPFWPGIRKPSWWIVLADDKSNRVVVPPLKISDIPYSRPDADRDYRAFKIQFQCPPTTGLFTWKIYVVSDTFVGEEATIDLAMKVEEPVVDDQGADDDISDPDEDTLAGQMAAMRGGSVKKIRSREEESDDESSTDDDKDNGDSDSDSD